MKMVSKNIHLPTQIFSFLGETLRPSLVVLLVSVQLTGGMPSSSEIRQSEEELLNFVMQ